MGTAYITRDWRVAALITFIAIFFVDWEKLWDKLSNHFKRE